MVMLTCTCYKILLVELGLQKKKKMGEEKALINGFMPIMRD